jgi:hypothetical protein
LVVSGLLLQPGIQFQLPAVAVVNSADVLDIVSLLFDRLRSCALRHTILWSRPAVQIFPRDRE